ncbi:MAG: hypothetical protein FWE67_15460, partial [Planctomycetaceae bacterium]|nr:hypothetical protein [Planctomycetaceae bacterium]
MSKKYLYQAITILFLAGFPAAGQVFAQVPPDPTRAESVHSQQTWDRYRIEQQIQQATSPLPGVKVTSPQLPPPDINSKSQQKIFKLNQVLFEPIPRSIPFYELDAIAA